MAAAIMVLGTASGVGKSWVCTALCRALARRGLSVAPFKAQNISNNAAPVRMASGQWGEIGRAQAAQALAAGCVPHVDMNPLLIKPNGNGDAQVVLLGEARGSIMALHGQREAWRQCIHEAYDRLAARHDVIVLEGAGSPAEINLQGRDLVNMSMAAHAIDRARSDGAFGGCLLVGDISRGGVFASLYGTLALLPAEHRRLVCGAVVNRFHGDPKYLEPGPSLFAARAGVPIVGVIQDRSDVFIDEEDTLSVQTNPDGELDIGLVHLPTVSNFTDVTPLQGIDGISIRPVRHNTDLKNPDLLIIPGSKDPLSDLQWLRQVRLDQGIQAAAARQIPILGICGGYQLLGEWLDDATGVSGPKARQRGLGLLPVRTQFSADKRIQDAQGTTCGGWLLPAGLPVRGYEIHHGRTAATTAPLLQLSGSADGAIAGSVAGTYLHGLLEDASVCTALINALRQRRALPPLSGLLNDGQQRRQQHIDAAADALEAAMDVDALLKGDINCPPRPDGGGV